MVKSIFLGIYIIFAAHEAGYVKKVLFEAFHLSELVSRRLQRLALGYGDKISPEEVQRCFEEYGGLPRSVVVHSEDIAEQRRKSAEYGGAPSLESPGLTIFFTQRTVCVRNLLATTPKKTYNKYVAYNVIYDYPNAKARELAHNIFERLSTGSSCNNREFQIFQVPRYRRDNRFQGGMYYDLMSLQQLTDPSVLYRLPEVFRGSIISLSFILGVDTEPSIEKFQAVKLCRKVIPTHLQVNVEFL